jgi:hypothetical protein
MTLITRTLRPPATRVVERPQQARLGIDEGQGLALVPAMVAAGDRVHPRFEHDLADLARDAEAGRCILAIGNHHIGGETPAQIG